MCGICGIIRKDRNPVDRDLLEQMNSMIIHRGPDGDGFHYSQGVGLAMRRLAVIDLNTGDQPIPNEDKSVWIVFNGEIFNFPELREDLEARGHCFRTLTDTECIVHLYEEFGDECVQHLRGQFAFAIWDQTKERVFIGRDRAGQKPLYYTMLEGNLVFSSELSSLLSIFPSTPNIDLPAIDFYLSLQYIPEPMTPYEGIYKLPAAHTLTYERGKINISPYWQLQYEPKRIASEEKLVSELRELLTEAVRIRMISDVPLGAHLSGGIDSSIVVAIMAGASNLPVKTFSVGFEEAAFSELPYARAVAERYGTDHHEFTLSYGDIPNTLETLIGHFGEPFADPSAIPLYFLSKLTRESVTVALNGDGGDEAFAGYQRYWLDPWADRYTRLPRFITQTLVPGTAALFLDRVDKPAGGSFVNGLKKLGQITDVDSRASILRWGSYFSPEQKMRLWRDSYKDQAEAFLVSKYETAPAESLMDRTLSTDFCTYLPGDLLVKADRMTMAHSLEGRSPFLDHKLAEWAARLPEQMKVRGFTGKYLLRKAFAGDLPASVVKRGKQGFSIPVGDWFRGPLAGWAEEVLLGGDSQLNSWFETSNIQALLEEHRIGRENHGKRIYALVMLGLWAKRYQ
jgi:asparagine synthase (glutamine-hydrolysing)